MFRDRSEAGERLARRVAALGLEDPVVLALPRGGVPVALPVAQALRAPLDLLIVRKIGVPGNEELAAGAAVEGEAGVEAVFNPEVLAMIGRDEEDFAPALAAKAAEIAERRARLRGGRPPISVQGRDVVVVDDGVATGATMRAALKALARLGARSVTLAVPVAPPEALARLRPLVRHLVCLESPEDFRAVGLHYADFAQVGEAEVARLLAAAQSAPPPPG